MNISIPSNFPLAHFLNDQDIDDSVLIGHSRGNYVGIDSSICCLPGSLIPDAGRKLITGEETQEQVDNARIVIRTVLKGEMERTPEYQIKNGIHTLGDTNYASIEKQLKKFDELCTDHPYLTKGELKTFFQEHNITVEQPRNLRTGKANEKTPLLLERVPESSQGGGRYNPGYGAAAVSKDFFTQQTRSSASSKTSVAGKGGLGVAKDNIKQATAVEEKTEQLVNQSKDFFQLTKQLNEQQKSRWF